MIDIATIKRLLLTNDRAVERAMVVLFERQTASEQSAHSTTESNGRGFSAFDAKSGTYYAQWVMSGRRLSGRFLTKARVMSLRYARQLLEVAEAKQAAKEERAAIIDDSLPSVNHDQLGA